ncbi:glycosyltransferase family 2 protein [Endothiovibrio diazotrophicus]
MKLSVVIPLHNKGPYIERTLDRLLDQRRVPDEIIVVDDAGSDDGAERVARIRDRWNDRRLTLIRLPVNGGPGHARNVGLDAASGDYVMPLDADDPLDRHAVARVIEVLETHAPDFLILTFRRSSDGVARPTVGRLGGLIEPLAPNLYRVPDPIAALADEGVGVIGSNLVCRREALDGIRYDTTTRCFEGVDFWYRALRAARRPVLLLAEPLLDYVILPDGLLSHPITDLSRLDYPVLLLRLRHASTPAERALRRRLARAWVGNAWERLTNPVHRAGLFFHRPRQLSRAVWWGWLRPA